MKRTVCIILLLLLCAQCALAENLLSNPDFESYSGTTPNGWHRDCWYNDTGVSYLEVDPDGYEGACIKVYSASENDARFVQEVDVEPDTLYEIRCMAKAEGIPSGLIGANISVGSTFVYSSSAYDTDGEWVELKLYGRTGEDQDSLEVFARLGGYSNLNYGCAWFDSFSMTEIESVPAGFEEQSFATFAPSKSSSDDDSGSDEAPQRYTETWLLLAFGMVLAYLVLVRKFPAVKSGVSGAAALSVILFAAFLVRLFISYKIRGYNTDINCFTSWGAQMRVNGAFDFYSKVSFCDYPPLYMLLLGAVDWVRELLGIDGGTILAVALMKLTPIMCDIALALIVWFIARKRLGEGPALALAAALAFNPAMIADSAAWGQIDSVFTLFIIVSAVLVVNQQYIPALVLITLGMLTKPQALLVAPLGLIAVIVNIIRGDRRIKHMIHALIGLSVSVTVILIITFAMYDESMNPFEWLSSLYFNTVSSYDYMTVNACNLYELLGLNWAKMDTQGFLRVFAWAMFAGAYVYSGTLTALSKRREHIFISAACLLMLICAFGPMIHERYVFPALICLFFAYAYTGDMRLRPSLLILSLTLFLNEVLVLQGGMTEANYGHLQNSERLLNHAISALNVANAVYTCVIGALICFRDRTYAAKPREESPAPVQGDYRLNLRRFDYLFIAGITLAYSVLTFTNLGVTRAPESSWTSSSEDEYVLIDLGDVETWRMEYYGGICNTSFGVSLSNDGEEWTETVYAKYDQGQIFRWLFFEPQTYEQTLDYSVTVPGEDGEAYITYAQFADSYPYQTSRYVMLTPNRAGLVLSEIGFIREDGTLIEAKVTEHEDYDGNYYSDPKALFDEQDTVPEYPTYLNSTYFDEIYHARTAYEHAHAMSTYEWTHPPLGKVLMMFGVKIFGMTPFGWRFMGALMGVLMLPVIYLIAKQLGLSSKAAALATFLLSVDAMHFTQTRIATIDSYAVFFIMLMYLFMIRYVKMSFNRQPLIKTLIPLALCGVTMGCAWATKWIGFYASIGLVVMFFASFITRFVEYIKYRLPSKKYWRDALVTTGVCIVFFIIIPALIYYLSYYWQLQYEGGLRVSRVLELQKSMLNYHAGLGNDTHYFRSPWYEWPVIAWPMWYYSGTKYLAEGMVSSISCMGTPAVWWTGLIAIAALLVYVCAKKGSGKAANITALGFLSQYLPWVLVPRSTFIYHYFASVPFIILAQAFWFDHISNRHKKLALAIAIALCAIALLLFIMFYPLESGLPMAEGYAKYLRWFKWYNY